jgi:hypothetical protein
MKDSWDEAYAAAKKLTGTRKREISEGDRYLSEQGEEISFDIAGKQYSIGYVYITEDDDDWAQAECYEIKWTSEGDFNITPAEMMLAIESAKQEERDNKISALGI